MSEQIIAVPPGAIATIVTSLEMTRRPPAPVPVRSALRLVHWPAPVDAEAYLDLFRRIGEPCLWRGRLVIDAGKLAAILDAPTTEIHVATRRDGTAVGLLELDFAVPGDVEIAYFGLVPGMTGHGHGNWLMAHAMARGWRAGIGRMWVHTCDLDHPAALGFYQRQGFSPFARAVEIYPDPRTAGLYPLTAAPGIVRL